MTQQFITETEIEKRAKLRNVTVLIVYAILAFYFLINGESLLAPYWESAWTFTIIIYMVGVALFVSVAERLPKQYVSKRGDVKGLESPILDSVIGLCIAFVSLSVVFIIIRDLGLYFTTVTPMPVAQIPANLVYQLIIVSFSEEIIFRGVIFRFLYGYYGWLVAYLGSALIFALFHYSAYSGDLQATAVAFLLGIAFAYCVDRWNIGVAVGVHWCWNSAALGIIMFG